MAGPDCALVRIGAGLAAGRFVLGAAIDAFGADRLLRCSTIAIVVGSLVFAFANGIWAAVGLILAGLALSPVFPTLMARAPERTWPFSGITCDWIQSERGDGRRRCGSRYRWTARRRSRTKHN
jgi:MFS family permease